MTTFVERMYDPVIDPKGFYILGADIGGTNSNFGIFQVVNDQPHLHVSFHTKSQEITNFTQVMVDLMQLLKERYGIAVSKSCFGAAGVTQAFRTWCKPTNLSFIIDAKDILKNTSLSCAFLANDFEVIGHGLQTLPAKDIIQVKEGEAVRQGNKAIIGAGTGLGKAILVWNRVSSKYMPVCSEGGHADFSAQNARELSLAQFIQKTESWKCAVSWEDVLSGNGISRIYHFFQTMDDAPKSSEKIHMNGPHPDEIFKSRFLDDHAWNTYRWYSHFYGRCVKNFALDSLAQGGIYVAGGIATHNVELFQQDEFTKEFLNCGKQKDLLARMPIYVIGDYNVSLYGAAWYLLLEGLCRVA